MLEGKEGFERKGKGRNKGGGYNWGRWLELSGWLCSWLVFLCWWEVD